MLEAFCSRFPELTEQEAQELHIEMTEGMLTGKTEFQSLWDAAQNRLRKAVFDRSEIEDLIDKKL